MFKIPMKKLLDFREKILQQQMFLIRQQGNVRSIKGKNKK